MKISAYLTAFLVFCLTVSPAFAQKSHMTSPETDYCVVHGLRMSDGSMELQLFDMNELTGFSNSAGDTCAGDKLYTCDDGSGGTSSVRKKSDCSKCSTSNPNHCDGCCDYFCDTAACQTACCAGQCGSVC